MTKDAPGDLPGLTPLAPDQIPAGALGFVGANLDLWTRDKSTGPAALKKVSFYHLTEPGKVPLAGGGSGQLIFPKDAIVMVAPQLHATFNDDFLASAASMRNLVFSGLGQTQALLIERGLLQDYSVMEEESVAFNVVMKASIFGSRVLGDQTALNEALDLTGLTGLTGRNNELSSHLSGGEKQRLTIARAIYKNAKAVFVDEPTASLDEANRTRVISLFRSLAARGCTVIVATPDDEMMAACDTRHSLVCPELVTNHH